MRLALWRLAVVVAFLSLWELAADRWVPAIFISRPSRIFSTLMSWILDGTLFFHAGITAMEAFGGFLLGSVLGIAAGLALGRSARVAEVVGPFILAFYSLPKLALAPLFILWFGIGMNMKIAFTGAIVFFLVFLNTFTGVRNVSRELVTILQLMGATNRYVLLKVVVPSAVTWVFTGLRISVPYALVGAVIGELVAANRGLGYLLASSAGQFDTAGLFAALAGIIALSGALNLAVSFVERFAIPWQRAGDDRGMAI